MKKIPTLFERVYENHKIVDILPNVTEDTEWVLSGGGIATVKVDGSCCTIIGGELYKWYDAKKGKKVPEGAIKCQDEPDPITGHLPCWVRCDRNNPADKWFWKAFLNYVHECSQNATDTHELLPSNITPDGTYEAIGTHFQGNPYGMKYDTLVPHGKQIVDVERTFDGIKKYLSENYIEGIMFWKDGQPRCKIKRSDFGFSWN